MPERKKPDESQRIARLLLKSIESLQEAERKKVLEYIVAAALRNEPGGGLFTPLGAGVVVNPRFRKTSVQVEPMIHSALTGEKLRRAMQGGPEGEQQMVPMRFPKEQYESFKSWCEENGFSMAVVVRGLVERFLEEQGKRAS